MQTETRTNVGQAQEGGAVQIRYLCNYPKALRTQTIGIGLVGSKTIVYQAFGHF